MTEELRKHEREKGAFLDAFLALLFLGVLIYTIYAVASDTESWTRFSVVSLLVTVAFAICSVLVRWTARRKQEPENH